MENGEDIAAGAARETLEEARADVEILRLHSVYSIPRIHQVHVFFLARMTGSHAAGTETLETRLVLPSEIPWDSIAFRSVEYALRVYVENPDRTDTAVSAFPG